MSLLAARRGSLRRRPSGGGDGAAYAAEVMSDSPAAYWRMDEASGDLVDQVAGETITVNAATYQVATPIGLGLTFGGHATLANMFTLSSFTWSIEFLLRLNSASASPRSILAEGTSDDGLYVDDMIVTGRTTLDNKSSGITLSAATWYHVAVTSSNASGNLAFYINGTAVDFPGWRSSMVSGTGSTLRIGSDGFSQGLDGTLSEFAIYSTELAAARVAAHQDLAGT